MLAEGKDAEVSSATDAMLDRSPSSALSQELMVDVFQGDMLDAANKRDAQRVARMEVDSESRPSSHQSLGRARDDCEPIGALAPPVAPEAAAAAQPLAVLDATAQAVEAPEACLTVAELKERAVLMFIVGRSWPTASGRPPAMAAATKKLVVRCWAVVEEMCRARGKELSASFGNFDKLVAAGWLLGDVVLGCLLTLEETLAVGRKAGKLVPAFRAEFAAPRRRAGKQKLTGIDAEERRARAFMEAAAEEAAVRSSPAALPLPSAAPAAAKRRRVVAAELGGEPEAVVEPEPEHLQHLSRLQVELEACAARLRDALEEEAGARSRAAELGHEWRDAQRALRKATAAHEKLGPAHWDENPTWFGDHHHPLGEPGTEEYEAREARWQHEIERRQQKARVWRKSLEAVRTARNFEREICQEMGWAAADLSEAERRVRDKKRDFDACRARVAREFAPEP
jgi:hypothetical protein